MKNLSKLIVIFLALFIIFSTKSIAADRILPLSKPSVDEEAKTITAKKKIIYPKKKPDGMNKENQIEVTQETSEEIEKSNEEVFIYPEKKPIIVKKTIDKAVAKSSILSKSDFKIAKAAFEAIDKKKWQTAIKISKRAKDKMVFKMVYWFYLIEPINTATFFD